MERLHSWAFAILPFLKTFVVVIGKSEHEAARRILM